MLDTVFDILKVIGSLCLFIYGMKTMSEGIQGAAGSQLRNILRSMTKNKYVGVFSGFLVTALVQSSSATTVMTVSFVNAGLLTLSESVGVMMGANIGTTITGWLATIGTGKFEISDYVLPLLAFGFPMMFITRGRFKFWGEFLVGFSLLFLGLNFLQLSVPDLQNNPEWLEFLKTYANDGYLSIIAFVIIGAIMTIIIQSSSAAMALTLVMVTKEWIPIETAGALILGENIGTTLTAEVAAFIGNIHAKRSARIHSLFNVIGVIWVIILLPFIIPFLNNFVETRLLYKFSSVSTGAVTIALFHTLFNLSNVLLLIGFTPWLIKLTKRTIRSNGEEDKAFRLAYIDTMVKTPELTIIEVQKEVLRFGELTSRMSGFARTLFLSTDRSEQKALHKRIKKYEGITNRVELELSSFLAKISSDRLSSKTSLRVRNLLNVCSYLERIGDIYLQISKNIKRKSENKIWFNQIQRERLLLLFDMLDEAFVIMIKNLSSNNYDQISMTPVETIEKQINKFKKSIRSEAFKGKGDNGDDVELNIDSQIIFTLLVNQLEKIGNNIYNVSETLSDNR